MDALPFSCPVDSASRAAAGPVSTETMIAPLPLADAATPLDQHYVDFLKALKAEGFEGEIAPDYASRTVLATDNSLYQRLPQAAVFPRHAGDL